MKVVGYQHNGKGAVIALNDMGDVTLYRVPSTIGSVDGELDGAEMHEAIRVAQPLKGNVSPDLAKALGEAMACLLREVRSHG